MEAYKIHILLTFFSQKTSVSYICLNIIPLTDLKFDSIFWYDKHYCTNYLYTLFALFECLYWINFYKWNCWSRNIWIYNLAKYCKSLTLGISPVYIATSSERMFLLFSLAKRRCYQMVIFLCSWWKMRPQSRCNLYSF